MRGAPSVFPASSEITLLKDEDVWLNCSSPEPIIWQFEESFQNIKDVRKIDSYNDGEYRSAIHITKANEEHVGQYYCIKESARDFFDEYKFHLDDLEAQFNATSIYVFVSGLKNTVVPQTEKTITRDQVDGLDFVVQCKPTAKDVEVELVTYNESQRIQIGRMSYNSSSEDFCLDTISQTLTIERLTMDDAGSYKCMTSNRIRHEIEYGNFKLFVLDHINDYKLKFDRARGAPIVYPNSSEITLLVDDELWIRCSSPEKIKDVDTKNHFIDGMYLSSFHITKANEEHVGQYYCIKEKARDFSDEYKFHLDDLEAQFNATSIYVFVTGLKSTVVPQRENNIEAVDGLDFVAQCKPTSKEVLVELVTNDGLHNSIGFLDRKRGVYLGFDDVDNEKEYLCRDKDIHSITIILATLNVGE
ncbi:Dpse\GA20908-PA-like protein [Anopheles sinensis]|uniref:Platelet-derived growth factor receptor-like protein n=1 Tax=Anopheles sinensis TaxID=74873 RepID=A0A084W3X0_ANOSI|nr:Dpse\GA20908-PA-like protein [Anopheles sinensis]